MKKRGKTNRQHCALKKKIARLMAFYSIPSKILRGITDRIGLMIMQRAMTNNGAAEAIKVDFDQSRWVTISAGAGLPFERITFWVCFNRMVRTRVRSLGQRVRVTCQVVRAKILATFKPDATDPKETLTLELA